MRQVVAGEVSLSHGPLGDIPMCGGTCLRRLRTLQTTPVAAGSTVDAPPEPRLDPAAGVRVAVLIERLRQPTAWEDWRFRVHDVVVEEPGMTETARLLRDDGRSALFLFPGLSVTLHRDEGEGYHLNLTSPTPSWFVMWRTVDHDASQVTVETVTCSYHEAGRLLDAQERVDPVPMPPAAVAWLADYTAAHWRPEPKERRRPASFQAPGERR